MPCEYLSVKSGSENKITRNYIHRMAYMNEVIDAVREPEARGTNIKEFFILMGSIYTVKEDV